MSDIALSSAELFHAAVVGAMRRITSLFAGMDTDRHAPCSSWATDIDAAAAELALAKHLGSYWGGHVRNFKGSDVGRYQVRSTTYEAGCLIIRDRDPEGDYVLVVCKPPIYSIRGFISSAHARATEFRRESEENRSAAWWIPQDRLLPLELKGQSA